MSLAGKTLLVTGGSRGIGLAIALRAARDGANVAVAAKTTDPHARLNGTIHEAAGAIERAGGKALAVAMDIRSDDQIQAAVEKTVGRFGGIDILVNNAGALHRGATAETDMKRVDLLFDINSRGAYVATRACLPHLRRAANPHVLSVAPLLIIDSAERYAAAPAFMISKFNLSLMTMAFAAEFRSEGIAFNALWPRLSIWTAARQARGAADERLRSRRPEIMADAAWHILTQESKAFTGRFTLDEDVLRDAGVTDFSPYYFEGANPAEMHGVFQVSHGLVKV